MNKMPDFQNDKHEEKIESAEKLAKDGGKLEVGEFSPEYMGKKLITGCVISSLVSIVTVFVVMKIGLGYHEERIQTISENYTSLDLRMKSISDSIKDINLSLESLKSDLKNTRENSSYLYKGVATLQKDLVSIKSRLNMDEVSLDDSMKKLSSEKASFIESFENLSLEGAPFDSFIDSCADKIDMKKYHTSPEILKFSRQSIKSHADLVKDFSVIGLSLFKVQFEESFWEKQKRIVKEKILDAVKIRKTNEDGSSTRVEGSMDDKSKFETAGKMLSDHKYEDAIKLLESMRTDDEQLSRFLVDLKKRRDLEAAFSEFKKEFLEAESN